MHQLIEIAKRCKWIRRSYTYLRECLFQATTVVSPVLNTKMRYWFTHGKRLDLKKPKTFHEKLLWLKLFRYMKDPLVIQCADKYLVREYVKQCGYEHILNDLLGVWDRIEDVPWDDLPQQFALKWNFGAGFNLVCESKKELQIEQVVQQFHEWERQKCWLSHSEMHYKYIPKRIVCERYLKDNSTKDLFDYKVYCFHGIPKAILVMQDRSSGVKTEFFDTNWIKLNNTKKYREPAAKTAKPVCLDQMIAIATKLSKPFPFVRCDFYVVNQRLYFGELTFTPAAGMYTSETTIHGTNMADLIQLPTDS